jgi:hypothetical protein
MSHCPPLQTGVWVPPVEPWLLRHSYFRSQLGDVATQGGLTNENFQIAISLTYHSKVQTDDQAGTQGRDKDPRSLSGGEKSFATICLLLSLWDSIGCPLRCLGKTLPIMLP